MAVCVTQKNLFILKSKSDEYEWEKMFFILCHTNVGPWTSLHENMRKSERYFNHLVDFLLHHFNLISEMSFSWKKSRENKNELVGQK